MNQIVALAALAVMTKAAYSLGKVYSPKVEISPLKPEGLNAEVKEFMNLPPRVQKQLLQYGSKWQEALFES